MTRLCESQLSGVKDTSVSAPGSNTRKIETVDYVPGPAASVQVMNIIP